MKAVLITLCMLLAIPTAIAQVDTASEQQIFESLNRERSSRGLSALALDDRLTEVARNHSAEMAQRHAISHQFAGEPDMTARIVASGVHVKSVGENVAASPTAETAHDALMHSPPHRENILHPKFDHVGIGVVREGDVLYVTEDFATSVEGYSTAEAEQLILRSIRKLREQSGAKPLKSVASPKLHALVCEMAREDLLSMAKLRTLPSVSTTVVFTTADLSESNKALAPLKTASGSSMSVGACYSSSASHPIPTYWVAVVTYF
jgi:hypothetical protein